mmetsp:Transcript_16414/g.36986  ORF Transcript_16414/g.36986 Transcript_16414/m.36986 type:complete len:562 (+) Transcript_16414:1290-2975(+)
MLLSSRQVLPRILELERELGFDWVKVILLDVVVVPAPLVAVLHGEVVALDVADAVPAGAGPLVGGGLPEDRLPLLHGRSEDVLLLGARVNLLPTLVAVRIAGRSAANMGDTDLCGRARAVHVPEDHRGAAARWRCAAVPALDHGQAVLGGVVRGFASAPVVLALSVLAGRVGTGGHCDVPTAAIVHDAALVANGHERVLRLRCADALVLLAAGVAVLAALTDWHYLLVLAVEVIRAYLLAMATLPSLVLIFFLRARVAPVLDAGFTRVTCRRAGDCAAAGRCDIAAAEESLPVTGIALVGAVINCDVVELGPTVGPLRAHGDADLDFQVPPAVRNIELSLEVLIDRCVVHAIVGAVANPQRLRGNVADQHEVRGVLELHVHPAELLRRVSPMLDVQELQVLPVPIHVAHLQAEATEGAVLVMVVLGLCQQGDAGTRVDAAFSLREEAAQLLVTKEDKPWRCLLEGLDLVLRGEWHVTVWPSDTREVLSAEQLEVARVVDLRAQVHGLRVRAVGGALALEPVGGPNHLDKVRQHITVRDRDGLVQLCAVIVADNYSFAGILG